MRTRLYTKATWGGRAVVAACLLAGLSGEASAQTLDPSRAFRGLFVPPGTGSSVTLTSDLYQGFNSGSYGPGTSESIYDRGTFTGVTSNLVAGHAGRSTTFGASGIGMVRYYADTGRLRVLFQGGAIGVRHKMRRMAIELQQGISQQPTYEFGNLRFLGERVLGGLGNINPEYGTDGYSMFASSSTVGAGFQVGRYQWISTGYRYAYSRISRNNDMPELPVPADPVVHSQEISARLSRQVWKDAGVHFDFMSSQGGRYRRRGIEPSAWVHNFNIGIDKLQNVSLTRTMSLSLTGGGSMLRDIYGQRFVFIGGGGIDKRFGRTTRAGVMLRRDIHFVEGLPDPVLTNGITTRFDAQFGNRWGLSVRANTSQGRAALAGNSLAGVPYQSYGGDARVRVRLAGPFFAYGEYVRYYQEFDDTTGSLIVGRPIDRNGLRVGLVMGIPLYGQRGVE